MIFKARLLKKPKLIKDYFSIQSLQYSKYRPTYPKKLYRYLLSECRDRKLAWDVGTGNGQAAKKLSIYFEQVYATDISNYQLLNAFQGKNIAEGTTWNSIKKMVMENKQPVKSFKFKE